MLFEQRWAALASGYDTVASVVRLGKSRILNTSERPPESGPPLLSIPRIRIFGDDVTRADFLLCVAFRLNGGEVRISAVGSESLRNQAHAAVGGLTMTGISLRPLPASCTGIEIVWAQLRPHWRTRDILNAVEGAGSALDYSADRRGAESLAASVLDHVELLLHVSDSPLVWKASLSADLPDADPILYYAVLPPANAQESEPQLWVRDSLLEVGQSPESTSEYQTGNSLLFRLGTEEPAGVARIPHRLQRRLSTAIAPVRSISDPVREVDKEITARRQRRDEIAVRFGNRPDDASFFITPVRVEVGDSLRPLVADHADKLREDVKDLIESIREESTYTVGFKSPGVRFAGGSIAASTYQISILGNMVDSGVAYAQMRWCRQPVAVMQSQAFDVLPGRDPRTGAEGAWLKQEDAERAESMGIRCSDAVTYLIDHLAVVLWKNAHHLITIDSVAALLAPAPAILAAFRSAPGGLPRFFTTVSALLQERVPLREWRPMANRYLEMVQSGSPPGEIVEQLRILPSVRPSLPGNDGETPLLLLRGAAIRAVRAGVNRQGLAAGIIVDPETLARVITELRNSLSQQAMHRSPVLVVDDETLRPYVRLLISFEFPDLHVLARREVLSPELIQEVLSSDESD